MGRDLVFPPDPRHPIPAVRYIAGSQFLGDPGTAIGPSALLINDVDIHK
jgi:hypothetical protein